MTRSRSIQPRSAAASIWLYSPEIWYAATGTGDIAAAAAMTSRCGPAGLTMTMSAPSAMSSSSSRSASVPLAGSCW